MAEIANNQEQERFDGNCQKEIQYIGQRIAYFRKIREMTQAELASKLNINKNYLSHIESGSAEKVMSLPLLIRISKALDIELAVLVDLNDLTNSKNIVREQFKEMKAMFNEMKEFNAELDKIIAGMDNTDGNTDLGVASEES